MFEKNNISDTERQAYAEVFLIIETLGRRYKDKIPMDIFKFIEENADKEYLKKIDAGVEITQRRLLKETLTIFSYLKLKYWCADDFEKEGLKRAFLGKNKK